MAATATTTRIAGGTRICVFRRELATSIRLRSLAPSLRTRFVCSVWVKISKEASLAPNFTLSIRERATVHAAETGERPRPGAAHHGST